MLALPCMARFLHGPFLLSSRFLYGQLEVMDSPLQGCFLSILQGTVLVVYAPTGLSCRMVGL